MKLLSKEDSITKVNYFGIELLVPERINYLATDKDGEVWAFSEEPVCYVSPYEEWVIPQFGVLSRGQELVAKVDLKSVAWNHTLKHYSEKD
jgi:hypothetical protein